MSIQYATQIIWSAEDEAYVALTAELPGCAADGKSQEEALANLQIVIREWIEVAKEEGRPIPEPSNVEDIAKSQSEAQAQLRLHIELEVKKAVGSVLEQLAKYQQPKAGFREGAIFGVEHAGSR